MASDFERFRYHAADDAAGPPSQPSLGREDLGRDAAAGPGDEPGFNSDEAAARHHLSRWMEQSDSDGLALRDVAAPDRPELVPDLRLVDTRDLAPTATRLVRFEQTQASIPVFGSRVVCELDDQRGFVSAEAQIAHVQGVPPVASLSPADALQRIADFVGDRPEGLDAAGIQPPELQFFQHPDGGPWHLVYYFRNVPAAPPDFLEGAESHGPGAGPVGAGLLVDYLVDAHNGEVVYYFSATAMLDLPVRCSGMDEHGATVEFFGRRAGSGFELRDPLRDVITYDMRLGDVGATPPPPLPSAPVQNASTNWTDTNKAAVSAHANASRVCGFFNGVLFRDGIDDKGMDLVNVVNCTDSTSSDVPPVWQNASWHPKLHRMQYGQKHNSSGVLVSYSRFLDVIAHELTHGVTQTTSDLVYRDQSGALNESFSDIFGIIIKNWDDRREDGGDLSTWDWEIGAGLGAGGLPLRDLSDPTRTRCPRTPTQRCPAHMDDYLQTLADAGGVHTNSNIHNKAAHNVLTARDASGNRLFTPREVAILYYLGLARLSRLATFSDARNSLIDVALSFYAGNATERQAKVDAIQRSYAAVGIT